MTERTLRHFSVVWPFVLAGAFGPRDADDPRESLLAGLPVATTADTQREPATNHRSSNNDASGPASELYWQSDAGAAARRAVNNDPPLAAGQELPGPEVVNMLRYIQVFGFMSFEVAVLVASSCAVWLAGTLSSDNVASTRVMTEAHTKSMEDAARALDVHCVQILYRLKNITRMRRLRQRLHAKLRERENL